jgi:hypothetical protein
MQIRPLRTAVAVGCAAASLWMTGAPASAQGAAAAASPSPLPSSAPSLNAPAAKDVEDPAVTVRAKDALHRVQTGTVDRAQLAEEYNAALTDATLTKAKTQLAALGEPQDFNFEGKAVRGNVTAYVYRVKFPQGPDLDEMIALDDSNKIVRLLFSLRPEGGAATPTTPAPPAPAST